MRLYVCTAWLLLGLLASSTHGQAEPEPWLMPGRPGLTAGTALVYGRPVVPENTAYVRTGPTGVHAPAFDWEFQRAHTFWAGYGFGGGHGVRFRAFVFDADPLPHRVALTRPGPDAYLAAFPAESFRAPTALLARTGQGPDSFRFSGGLRLVSTDWEVTEVWVGDAWTVEASAGVRHQAWRQEYVADLKNVTDGTVGEGQLLQVVREFTGIGPTVSLFARRATIGPWAVYGSLRGALLPGDRDETAAYRHTTRGPAGADPAGWGMYGSSPRTLPVTEVELGVEYRVTLGWLGLVLRGGATAQSYFGLGGPTGGVGAVHLLGGHLSAGVAF